ncbi:MAG TPA: sigma-70 family RNA polymerase sigma factor [Gaiellaceae bacterium]
MQRTIETNATIGRLKELRQRGVMTNVDLGALERLYRERYARFLRLAEAIVRDPELAREVVQETFARVIRSRSRHRGEGSVEAWVWRTLVNAARSAVRDRSRRAVAVADVPEPRGSANGHEPDDGVRALVAALPERQRLVLFLRYYADLDYRQIADALEIQEGTVAATLNHAHTAIRRALETEVHP